MKDFVNGNGAFAFDDRVPRPGPELYIVRLVGNEQRTCIILGNEVKGIWVHWNPRSNKSEPHFLDADKCPGCIAQRSKRWKGFLHCFDQAKSSEIFLELTPHSAASLTQQIVDPQNMRGNRIQVTRGKGDNGKIGVTMLTAYKDPDALPKEKDARSSILKLWGYALGADGHWVEGGHGQPVS